MTAPGSADGLRASAHTNATADVVVIGAGIAGASAAWALAQRSASVHLVEQEALPGHHATGRSAALLNETVGHPVVGALARASAGFLDAPPAGFVDHPLLARRGLLWVGTDAAALDDLARAAPAGAARRVDADTVSALVPAVRPDWAAAGGVHEPHARTVDVAALLQAYVRGLRRAGGTVHTGAPVRRITRAPGGDVPGRVVPGAAGSGGDRGRGWWVELPTGTIACRTVVNAAGAWGDVVAQLAGVRPLGLAPLRRTACIVRVPDGHEVDGWPLVMDVAGTFYAEPESGGLLVSPADETPSDPCDARPEELDVALALDRLRAATTLPVRSVRRAWAGLRTFAPDRAPVAGFDPDAEGFYWLVGQGGAGIKTAPALAAVAAADIAGEPTATGATGAPGGLDGAPPPGIVAALRPDRFR
jgi:D-arginine dehydrogenase